MEKRLSLLPSSIRQNGFRIQSFADVVATVINVASFIITCIGICTSIDIIRVNRTLWADEACLASSFSQRSPLEILTGGEFDYLQSAPLGWIELEKLFTLLLGNTEWVLRLGSFIAFTATIILLFVISKVGYRAKFPLLASTLYANTPIVLQYSGMFKPYLFDGFIAVSIICCFLLYRNNRIRVAPLALLWSVFLLFSSPSIFIECGLILAELILAIANKETQRAKQALILGSVVCASFLTYYFLWIRRMTSVADMQDFWVNEAFPLIPDSMKSLKQALTLTSNMLTSFGRVSAAMLACFIGSLFYAMHKKDSLVIGVFLTIAIALAASSLEFYPFKDRLWLFAIPPILLTCCITLNSISRKAGPYAQATLGASLLVLAMMNGGIVKYLNHPEHVYMKGQELNTEIDWLKHNLRADETIYVQLMSKPQFEYANGYGNDSFASENGVGNVVYSTTRFQDDDYYYLKFMDSEDFVGEIETVLSYPNIYIASSHTWQVDMKMLANAIHDTGGHLELVSYEYETPLWWYCEKLDDCKTSMDFEIEDDPNDPAKLTVTVRNTGATYINHPFDNVYLLNNETGEVYELSGILSPGESWNTSVKRPAGGGTLSLRSLYGQICANDSIAINGNADT